MSCKILHNVRLKMTLLFSKLIIESYISLIYISTTILIAKIDKKFIYTLNIEVYNYFCIIEDIRLLLYILIFEY